MVALLTKSGQLGSLAMRASAVKGNQSRSRPFVARPKTGDLMPDRELRQAPKKALTIILAGGRGSRLMDLTDNRAKPAVHFGGKYRIIDFGL